MTETGKGLVYHDLTPEEWDKIKDQYEGWTVLSDRGTIRPCTGCFTCWRKTHGTCVIKDGYENMGELIHRASQVTVISQYTYGGFSGFIKNLFDRSLGYVLPQFEITKGESHHKRRYREDKPFTFIFRGHGLREEEKDNARRYVQAVCTNIRGHVKEVIFEETGEDTKTVAVTEPAPTDRVIFLNASMRGNKANSVKFAKQLAKYLYREPEYMNLSEYLKDPDTLISALKDSTVVFCLPLYVDGLPSQLIRFLEHMEKRNDIPPHRVYVLANMGLYEPGQLVNLFAAMKSWCEKTGNLYCGGLGLAAGELISVLMERIPFEHGPSSEMNYGMKRLAEAVNNHWSIPDIYAGVKLFPRSLFMALANLSWSPEARQDARKAKSS